MPNTMNALQFLKKSRQALHLTQRDLAEKTGYSHYQIVEFERGRARVPGDLVLRIQKILVGELKSNKQ